MLDFTRLYTALDATTSTLEKRRLLRDFFASQAADDAAVALFFLTGGRLYRSASTKLLRTAIIEATGLPGWLVTECREQVGDLSETLALLHPGADEPSTEALSATYRDRLKPFEAATDDAQRRAIIEHAWGDFDADQRLVFHKLIRGGFRVGVQRRTVAHAIAELAGLDVATIQQRLTGEVDPTAAFWRRLLSHAEQPADAARPLPFCLANQVDPLPPGRVPDAARRASNTANASVNGEPDGRLLRAEAEWIAEQLGDPQHYTAEHKYDGIRAQLILRAGAAPTLFSRGEELVTEQFPEIIAAAGDVFRDSDSGVLDGELLMADGARLLPFFELQTRLGRKPGSLTQPSLFDPKQPVFIAYDILEHAGEDVRARTTRDRRAALERVLAHLSADHSIRLAPLIDDPAADPPPTWLDRARVRARSRARNVEGLMLKHVEAPYHTGRTRTGPTWWKWKVDPFSVDAVLVYAQPGTGRRATLFTDYTFALRTTNGTVNATVAERDAGADSERAPRDATIAEAGGDAMGPDRSAGDDVAQPRAGLVPFAKAYSGLTQHEIERVDRFVRQNTIDKMGPVRAVKPELVMEIGFESVRRSDRHASGVAVRFPRILRLRPDKSPAEADTIEAVERLLPE